MIKFPSNMIEHVAPVKEVRFYLIGIFFDHENDMFVATNGHMIIKSKAERSGHEESGIIPLDFWKDMRKRGVTDFSIREEIVTDNQGRSAKCIDGQYPNYHRAFPGDDLNKRVAIHFNAAYLDAVSKALYSKAEKHLAVTLYISPNEKGAPIVVVGNNDGSTAVISPLRK